MVVAGYVVVLFFWHHVVVKFGATVIKLGADINFIFSDTDPRNII